MKPNKMVSKVLSLMLPLSMTAPLHARASQAADRPPQYVLLAFDGSYKDTMWKYLRKTSKEMDAAGTPVHFTFFLNPVYVLDRAHNKAADGTPLYQPPGYHVTFDKAGNKQTVKNVGSAIGWGDNQSDISQRLDNMTGAYNEGHEMGSHAVGHWDGSAWSAADWNYELTKFFSFMRNVFAIEKIVPSAQNAKGLPFVNNKSIVGFRAPQLGISDGLYQELPQFGFQYDTSRITSKMDYWPERNQYGTWNFPLAKIPLPGTAKKYPTMDYNFCANDSKELLKEDPTLVDFRGPKGEHNSADCLTYVPDDVKQRMKTRMYNAYVNYFDSNYYGNRAPVSIGHHFSTWMGGAYFEAMMDAAHDFCTKPEVRCVPFRDLKAFMEDLEKNHPDQLAAYRAGDFEKMPQDKAESFDMPLDIQAKLAIVGQDLQLQLSGADAAMNGLRSVFYVNGRPVNGREISLRQIRSMSNRGADVEISASIYDRQHMEVQSVTNTLDAVGTANEKLEVTSFEEHMQTGDPAEAHSNETPDLQEMMGR